MLKSLTSRSSLDNLKREARRWLRDLRANVADARARLDRALTNAPDLPTLRDVQHALAREYGFDGWATLKTRLASGITDDTGDAGAPPDRARWFIDNACPDHHVRGRRAHVRAIHTAERILARYPDVAHDSFFTAIVCGNLAEVERVLAERPQAALEKGGPKNWEPLLYLAFTRLSLMAANDNAVAIARALLDAGADPNVFFMAGDSHYTPLTGVIGEGEEDRPAHPRRDELTQLLLDRGAEPYDEQVLYNTGFHGKHLWFLQKIYDASVARGRRKDWEDPEWMHLQMGGYGSGARWHLRIAVEKNDLELAEWCLSHGATPNAAPERDERFPRVSLLDFARALGHIRLADMLVRHGATSAGTPMNTHQAFVIACFALDRDAARALAEQHSEVLRMPSAMLSAVKQHRADVVELMLDLGMSPDIADGGGETALHSAAYRNALDIAKLLIERGAQIDPVDRMHNSTPLGWAAYADNREMVDLLAQHSRDVWELSYMGKIERLREVLAAEPERAKQQWEGNTPLMWLPPDDESRAIEIAELLIANGADPQARNKEGETAAERAARLGMFELSVILRERA